MQNYFSSDTKFSYKKVDVYWSSRPGWAGKIMWYRDIQIFILPWLFRSPVSETFSPKESFKSILCEIIIFEWKTKLRLTMLKLWLFDLKKIDSWWKVCMHHQLIAKITEIEKWSLRRFISFKGNFKKCNWRLNLCINRWMSVPRKALSGQEWMRYSWFIFEDFFNFHCDIL